MFVHSVIIILGFHACRKCIMLMDKMLKTYSASLPTSFPGPSGNEVESLDPGNLGRNNTPLKAWRQLFKTRLIRPFLPCQTQVNELNLTEVRPLNRLPHFCRTFDWAFRIIRQKCDTDSNVEFLPCRSNSYIMLMY